MSFVNRTIAQGLGSDDVVDVFVDGSTIYAATQGGFSISSDGGASFVNRTLLNGLGSNSVNSIFGNGSDIYVATNGGLSVLVP